MRVRVRGRTAGSSARTSVALLLLKRAVALDLVRRPCKLRWVVRVGPGANASPQVLVASNVSSITSEAVDAEDGVKIATQGSDLHQARALGDVPHPFRCAAELAAVIGLARFGCGERRVAQLPADFPGSLCATCLEALVTSTW